MKIELYEGLQGLPHFNPDNEPEEFASVMDLKNRLSQAAGLLISTPEYARGVPGSLKNALDWLVSGAEFVDKPVVLLSASTRSNYAYEALRTTLTTMSGRLIEQSCITVPLLGKNYDAAMIVRHADLADPLRAALEAFRDAISQQPKTGATLP